MLLNYRLEIDEIDKEIVKLYEQRLKVCKKIGEYKKVNNIEILNQNRENEVIENNLKNIDKELEDYIKNLLIFMMNESKNYQNK